MKPKVIDLFAGVEFSGEIWKTVCIDCYKDLQGDIPNEIFNDEIVSAVNR